MGFLNTKLDLDMNAECWVEFFPLVFEYLNTNHKGILPSDMIDVFNKEFVSRGLRIITQSDSCQLVLLEIEDILARELATKKTVHKTESKWFSELCRESGFSLRTA